jgi:hypothetical protein
MTTTASSITMTAARNMAHGEQLSWIARRYPDRTAYICGDTVRTFGDVDRRVTCLVNGRATLVQRHARRSPITKACRINSMGASNR